MEVSALGFSSALSYYNTEQCVGKCYLNFFSFFPLFSQ